MEVNRPDSIMPTNPQGGGQGGRERRQHEHDADGAASPGIPDDGAVAIEGLAADVTPAVQAALDALAGELEPLRYQVKLAHEREARLKEDMARHSFLPMPSRREFIRELAHVIANVDQLTTAPTLVVLHVDGADEVRRRLGRGAYEKALQHVAEIIRRGVHPTDAFGSLGGHDFGLVLLAADTILARSKADRLAAMLQASPYPAQGVPPLTLVAGVASLTARLSPDAALAYADRDLLGQVAAQAAEKGAGGA